MLNAPPSRICRDPRGWALSAHPFFCGLLGPVQQHLIPVDPLQGFVSLGESLPGGSECVLLQPDLQPSLHGFVGRKARGQHPPPEPRDEHVEHGMQTCSVVVRGTPIPTPDHRRENRLKERPYVIRHLARKVCEFHPQPLLRLFTLGPSQHKAQWRFCLIVLMTSDLEKTAAHLTQEIVPHPGAYPAPSPKQGLRVLQ